jgi:ABC-type sugar transport system ATPase subunit
MRLANGIAPAILRRNERRLLFDEPLPNLDAKLRMQVRPVGAGAVMDFWRAGS